MKILLENSRVLKSWNPRRWASFGLILFSLFSFHSAASAKNISPDLLSFLQTAAPDEEVPVIIQLSLQADTRQIRDGGKTMRRQKIVETLRTHAQATQGPLRAFLDRKRARKIQPFWIVNALAASIPAATVSEIAAFPGVGEILLDETITPPPIQYFPAALAEWNIDAIRAQELWNLGLAGRGVVVANMDSGVDLNHPDLAPGWRGGANSWFDPFGEHPLPYDYYGHGSAAMGVMVGGSAGGTAIGVAPGAKWIAVKIYNDAGTGSFSGILSGFQWLLNPDSNPLTSDAPDIVNNSWSYNRPNECLAGGAYAPLFQAIQQLRAAGIAVVFSAGNGGPNPSTSVSPANFPGVVSVGAVDQGLNIAVFSARGPSACDGRVYPDIVAPGVGVKTAFLTSEYPYVSWGGTSFSAPHVAGAMALLLEAFPNLTVEELELAIRLGAQDLGIPGPDDVFGYGMLDVKGAYDLLLNPQPRLAAYPGAFDFGEIESGARAAAQEFIFMNRGLRELILGVGQVSGPDSAAFAIASDSCSGRTLPPSGSCRVEIFFSPLTAGLSNGVLSIFSNDPAAPGMEITLEGNGIPPRTKIGVYRGGSWYLDRNGNGKWDGCEADFCSGTFGGMPQDISLRGDWDHNGKTKIGIYRDGAWYLDGTGLGVWFGCDFGICYSRFGGLPGDIPVVGDWTGDGIDKIGIYRNGAWYLDRDGNGAWSGCGSEPGTDICFERFGGLPSDVPVGGDWTGTGQAKIGVYRDGIWFLDADGDGLWNPASDLTLGPFGGLPEDIPVAGDWIGDGTARIGIYRRGAWFLDANGNGVWDGCGVDRCVESFGGLTGDRPVAGK